MTITIRDIDALKSAGQYFEAGQLAKRSGRDSNLGCHFGFRSELDHARAEFKRGWDIASRVPTADQVRDYLTSYYATQLTGTEITLSSIVPSRQCPEALDCTVTVQFGDGSTDSHDWTVWIENGQPYGEW